MKITDDELIADIIEDGADYIEKNGWFRGDLYQKGRDHRDHSPACMMGGIMAANTMEDGHTRIGLYFIVQRFQEAIPQVQTLAAWNDYVAKDVQEVLDTMRLAAKRIRGAA